VREGALSASEEGDEILLPGMQAEGSSGAIVSWPPLPRPEGREATEEMQTGHLAPLLRAENELLRAEVARLTRKTCPGCKIRKYVIENAALRQALRDYASHQSWRCEYRKRYGKCVCGLDDFLISQNLEPVSPDDPEAK